MAEEVIERDESLNSMVDKLAEELEKKPDKWLNNPVGWLLKPSFTKVQTVCDAEGLASPTKKTSGNIFSDFKNRVKTSIISPYKRRWFVLSTEKRCLIYYKDDSAGMIESGFIDISQIIDVQKSNLSDAPPFAIDLMSRDRCFTLAAESEYQMLLWAYAINACRPQKIEGCKSPQKPTDASTDLTNKASKWSRYEYTFATPGPLMLNVMGTSNKDKKTGKVINNWIIVTSFESTVDGKPGRAEATGVISVKDYLVAVNGVDLMAHTFNESMNIINKATFPKVVTFLKDNGADRTVSRAEGWAIVYYPSLNRRRRRYVDIRWDSINFRKPAPGGSANAQRDAYISLGMVDSIQPIVDNTMLSDQRFVLRVTLKEGALMDHVGDDDTTIGTSPVAYLDLCFAKESQMKSWRSILASPSLYTAFETTSVPVKDLEVIDAETSLPQMSGDWANMAIKSELTGHFAPREFTVVRGHVHWMRVGQKQQMSRKKSLELATPTHCFLESARAVEVPETERNAYKFQLILKVKEHLTTIGMKDEAAIMRWLDLIKEAIAISPEEERVTTYISEAVERDEAMNEVGESSPSDGDKLEFEEEEIDLVTHTRATEVEGAKNGLQGYLYKKSNRMLKTHGMFRRRWFVLQDNMLCWYKSSLEADANILPQGMIDLSSAYEVRESIDPDAPENSLDIVTNAKILTLAAVDETDYELWLDALSDTLEIREMAIQNDNHSLGYKAYSQGLTKEERKAERIAAIRTAIVHGGLLSIKSAKERIFKATWKDRYFVIASGALTYYHDQSDMFDEHKDCKGEIALVNVLVVETPTDPKYKGAGYFDMHARVIEGGDANGMRVFSFNAQTPENAEKWMRELCRATEILELKHVGSNGFTSCVCEKMIMARNVKRMSVNTSAHNSSQTMIIQSNKWSEQDDDATSTVDSNDDGSSTLTKSERERERATNGMENGPGGHGGGRGGKRGGMGRGVFFKAGTGSQGYSRAANDTLGSIEENKEEMLGGSYDQLYGDGEL